MRRIIVATVAAMLLSTPALQAGVITLEWDADATWTAENCTGVIIYASPAGADTWVRVAKVPYPATSVRLRLPDIAGGYDYKATAYKHNPWQESAYSNTVTGTPDAAKSDKAAVLVVEP